MTDSNSTTTTELVMEVPQQDDRIYQSYKLSGSNNLECLLISDPSAEKAAAALSVKVGQLQDPPNLPGLAHLVEHMVFLGTEDFPVENEYDRYLSHHGGHSNAYTDLELTCFYCDVQVDALPGALQRFAACLTCPLLQESSLEREIQAVDSEHGNNKQQDFWRTHQLARTILGGGGKSDSSTLVHPYASFGSGNVEVLLPESENTHKQERIQLLRQQVVDFYQRYYKAENMKLVILGRDSIEDLKKLAEYFAKVPTAASPSSSSPDGIGSYKPDPIPPLSVNACAVKWVPVRECRTLEIQWILPEQKSLYQAKPAHHLSHLLGHEGPNSLLAKLRDLHWAHELSADDVSKTTSAFTIFALHIELTETGLEHYLDIINMVYAYIRLMQDIPAWVHEELAAVCNMQFRFLSKTEPSDTCSELAVNMQHYQQQHYFSGSYKIYDYQPELTQQCWQCLNSNNMYLFLGAKEFASETDQMDPWYGTQYKILSTDEWQQILKATESSAVEQFKLPEPNDMVATDFEIVPALAAFDTADATPRCLVDNSTCRLWYKPDTVFKMPKVNAMFLIRTPSISESPRQTVLSSLWAEIMQDFCNEFSYVASVAGLHCDVTPNSHGMEFTLSGYNHKAGTLLQRVCTQLQGFASKLVASPDVLKRIQHKLEERYLAFLVSQPYQHAMNAADLCLEGGNSKWSVQDRLLCLPEITVDDVVHFHQLLFQRYYLEVLVHGNVSAQQAVAWTNIFLTAFPPQPLLHSTALRVVSLSQGSAKWQFSGWNPDDSNCSIFCLYQMGIISLRVNAILGLLHHLLREPAFNQLRTEEQMGYIVHTGVKTNGELVKGWMILIQSETFDPVHMEERIEVFLQSFRLKLVSMSTADFEIHVKTLCQSFLEKNKNLYEESAKHWQAITNRTYHFRRLADLAAEAQHLSKTDVLMFLDRYILSTDTRRKLSIQVFGCNHPLPTNTETESSTCVVIDDSNEFVRSQMLYPVQKSIDIKNFMLENEEGTLGSS